jgi:hypothetical protein
LTAGFIGELCFEALKITSLVFSLCKIVSRLECVGFFFENAGELRINILRRKGEARKPRTTPHEPTNTRL